MELTEKILIENKQQAQSLIDSWTSSKYWHFLRVKDFEKYPALVCYYVDENDYSMSHSASVSYSITYKDDFED